MTEPTSCPFCHHSFQGDPIPQKYRDAGYFGSETHFSTVIGITSLEDDRIVRWKCPFCTAEWALGEYSQ